MFTEPQVACVGTTSGDQVVTVETGERRRLPPPRPSLVEPLGMNDSVIVGTVAAVECSGQLALAVRARMPLDTRRDTGQPHSPPQVARGEVA